MQLPDDLYDRAKRLAASREISLAEVIRRGLELLLQQYPEQIDTNWELPIIDVGRILVPLEQLHEIAAADLEPSVVAEDKDP